MEYNEFLIFIILGAVGEWSPQEKPSHKKMSQAKTSERKER
jgi:hypothetical protein